MHCQGVLECLGRRHALPRSVGVPDMLCHVVLEYLGRRHQLPGSVGVPIGRRHALPRSVGVPRSQTLPLLNYSKPGTMSCFIKL